MDTFQAAATFFDLLNMPIWAPADPDLAAKSKYAKYHAVRIAKAIKAGEDPNASNPVSEIANAQDPLDELERGIAEPHYQPPTVESAPESKQPSPPTIAQPFPPASATPLAPDAPFQNVGPPTAGTEASRTGSVGGGYFPSVPTTYSDSAQAAAPTAPSDIDSPADFYNPQPPATAPAPMPMAPPTIPASAPLPPVQAVPPGSYRTDDDSIMLASKHAKWAISALNFEDVNTAVKELRLALQSLGAQ